MQFVLKAPGTFRLKQKFNIVLSTFAFKFNLRRYNLDVKNVAWLEEYLCSQTTISSMIVSHDAGFLDRVCTHIIHFETRKLVTYKAGAYTRSLLSST